MNKVILGNQIWASTNLMEPLFRNGDEIPLVNNYADWESYSINEQPCCAYVDNKPSMKKYGLFLMDMPLLTQEIFLLRDFESLGFIRNWSMLITSFNFVIAKNENCRI
jgi:hypothetical protein